MSKQFNTNNEFYFFYMSRILAPKDDRIFSVYKNKNITYYRVAEFFYKNVFPLFIRTVKDNNLLHKFKEYEEQMFKNRPCYLLYIYDDVNISIRAKKNAIIGAVQSKNPTEFFNRRYERRLCLKSIPYFAHMFLEVYIKAIFHQRIRMDEIKQLLYETSVQLFKRKEYSKIKEKLSLCDFIPINFL